MADLTTPEQFAVDLAELAESQYIGTGEYVAGFDGLKATALVASRDRALLAPFVALEESYERAEAEHLANAVAEKSRGRPDLFHAYMQAAGHCASAARELRAAITAARGEQGGGGT